MEYAKTLSLTQAQGIAQASLSKICKICDAFRIISLNRQIEACKSLLANNPPIDVAVLGQFKTGKSSFINSLVDKPILPVGVVPVTTVITRLQYGEKERVVVTHFDGTASEVPTEELENFTSEARNPGNRKNVDVVDIELPSLESYAGLRLVDTPGLGSIFKYHMETSENWLPEVGAALLAVSAGRPLSENDLQLIREVMRHTPRIILLITKADLLSEDQRDEISQFFQQTLRRELNREFPTYFYSTRTNTDLWKEHLEKQVFFKLSKNRDEEFRNILRHKIHSLLGSCMRYLEIALKTSLQADVEREELRSLILDEKLNYDSIRETLLVIAREISWQTRPLIAKRLDEFHGVWLTEALREALGKEIPAWKGNLWRLTRTYEKWLIENLTERIEHISKNEHRHFFATLKKAHASLSRSIESFRNLLNDNLEKVLGLGLAEADWKIEVTEPSQPDIKTSRVFDSNIDLLWFLIPMFIFRPLFEKHFRKEIPREVEVNLSRLAAQWEERINRAIDGMRKQAERYVEDELSTIEALLSKTCGQTDEIRGTIEELHGELSRLEG